MRKQQIDLIKERWQWGETSPFYSGDDWRDYVTSGGLVESIESDIGFVEQVKQLRALLLNQPRNTLLTYGLTTALPQIENSFYSGSPRDLPNGFYRTGTTFRLVLPNYKDNTLSRYTFQLIPMSTYLANQTDPRLIEAANEFIKFVEDIMPFDIFNFISYDELGYWDLRATETVPLERKGRTRGALDGVDTGSNNDDTESDTGNVLPLLLAGGGLVTGQLWLSALGLFLRLRNGNK